MEFGGRTLGFAIMGLILAFTLIHLGVSIGIIIPQRQYADVFRPQIGLASFNLVICVFGFVAGILGLISLIMKGEQIGKCNAEASLPRASRSAGTFER